MEEIRSRALVLRTFDQGESDRLVRLYTEARGRVSAIAKGARRSRRRFPGTLEILNILDVRLVEPPRASLLRLEGASLVRPFELLVNDLGRYSIACQLLEILDRLTGEAQPNPELFRFALGVLEVLASEPPDRLLALLVMLKALAHLGFRPELASCVLCGTRMDSAQGQVGFAPRHGGAVCRACHGGEAIAVSARLLLALDRGIRTPLRERGGLALVAADVRRAELLLDRFFCFHVGVELKSTLIGRAMLGSERLDVAARDGDTALARGGRVSRVPETDSHL